MGKGDQKTRRGKLFKGTFGVRRKKKKNDPYKPAAKKSEETKDNKPEILPEKPVKKTTAAKKVAGPKKTAEAKVDDKTAK